MLHTCKRCGFETKFKQVLYRHFQRKTQCDPILSEIDVKTLLEQSKPETNEEAKFTCEFCDRKFNDKSNKRKHELTCKSKTLDKEGIGMLLDKIEEMSKEIKTLKSQGDVNPIQSELSKVHRENQRLRNEIIQYKKLRTEDFYQVIVENWLGGTHSTNAAGITDVTNETTHAEIKCWKKWKNAMGQLLAYQTEDHREYMYVCLFGKYEEKYKKKAIEILAARDISAFEFIEENEVVAVISAASGEIVYEYSLVRQANLTDIPPHI